MWMFVSGAAFGLVIGYLVCSWMSANTEPACINCTGLIERDQALDAANKDVKALCEEIKTLRKSNASLRGFNKRAVDESHRLAFFHQKEA